MALRWEYSIAYLELLRNKGMLRTDITLEAQIRMIAAICMGFFVVGQFLPPDYQASPDEMVEALVETLHRTVEPENLPPPDVIAEVTHFFHQSLDQMIETVERAYKEIT